MIVEYIVWTWHSLKSWHGKVEQRMSFNNGWSHSDAAAILNTHTQQ